MSTPAHPLGRALEPVAQVVLRAVVVVFAELAGQVHVLHESRDRLLAQMAFGLNGSGFAQPMPNS